MATIKKEYNVRVMRAWPVMPWYDSNEAQLVVFEVVGRPGFLNEQRIVTCDEMLSILCDGWMKVTIPVEEGVPDVLSVQ